MYSTTKNNMTSFDTRKKDNRRRIEERRDSVQVEGGMNIEKKNALFRSSAKFKGEGIKIGGNNSLLVITIQVLS
jgi:hypothetical protein